MNISSPKHFQREFSKSQVSPHQSLPYSVHCHLWLSLKVLGDLVPAYLPTSPLTVPPFHPGHSHHSRLCFLPGPVSAFWAFPRAGPFTWNFPPPLFLFPTPFHFRLILGTISFGKPPPWGTEAFLTCFHETLHLHLLQHLAHCIVTVHLCICFLSHCGLLGSKGRSRLFKLPE